MQRLPLNALRAFDLVAREGSMAAAATAQGVTTAAISRQISILEETLGTTLLKRSGRGVSLTETGRDLSRQLRDGFDLLESGVERFAFSRQRRVIVVGVPRNFAIRWLAPRLQRFRVQNPRIEVHVDGVRHEADLERREADVAIRYGSGSWPEATVSSLGNNPIFPVCSPGFLGLRDPMDALRKGPLFHFSDVDDWSLWTKAKGLRDLDIAVGPRFSDTAMTLSAAEAGQGFAMARPFLVEDALRDGRLVAPFGTDGPADRFSYYLVMTRHAAARPSVNAFASWLLKEIGAAP